MPRLSSSRLPEPVNFAPSVLRTRRVLHFAVWSHVGQHPGPLCRRRIGDWTFGISMEFPGVPLCKFCIREMQMFQWAYRFHE